MKVEARRSSKTSSLGRKSAADRRASMSTSDAEELFMTKAQYEVFEALNPFFGVVLKGLRGLVDGKHYFDTFAEDVLFDLR
jgi:hypothetical protein